MKEKEKEEKEEEVCEKCGYPDKYCFCDIPRVTDDLESEMNRRWSDDYDWRHDQGKYAPDKRDKRGDY